VTATSFFENKTNNMTNLNSTAETKTHDPNLVLLKQVSEKLLIRNRKGNYSPAIMNGVGPGKIVFRGQKEAKTVLGWLNGDSEIKTKLQKGLKIVQSGKYLLFKDSQPLIVEAEVEKPEVAIQLTVLPEKKPIFVSQSPLVKAFLNFLSNSKINLKTHVSLFNKKEGLWLYLYFHKNTIMKKVQVILENERIGFHTHPDKDKMIRINKQELEKFIEKKKISLDATVAHMRKKRVMSEKKPKVKNLVQKIELNEANMNPADDLILTMIKPLIEKMSSETRNKIFSEFGFKNEKNKPNTDIRAEIIGFLKLAKQEHGIIHVEEKNPVSMENNLLKAKSVGKGVMDLIIDDYIKKNS